MTKKQKFISVFFFIGLLLTAMSVIPITVITNTPAVIRVVPTMTVIPRNEGWGEILGAAVGELVGFKLAQSVKANEQQKERVQFAKGLAPLIGQDMANFISNLGPDERKYALQNMSYLIQLNQSSTQSRITFARAKLLEDIFTPPYEKREREKLEIAKKTLLTSHTTNEIGIILCVILLFGIMFIIRRRENS